MTFSISTIKKQMCFFNHTLFRISVQKIDLKKDVPLALGRQNFDGQKYKERDNAWEVPRRLLSLMRAYYEDAHLRSMEYNKLRFMYEESPHYEMGYVMHELIERYKKLVENMKRLVEVKTHTFYDNVDRVEMMQKLYFEVYHLANMIHEIPRKWHNLGEFSMPKKLGTGNDSEATMSNMVMKQRNARQKREARERKKMLKKHRQMVEKGYKMAYAKPPGTKKEPYNQMWPIDYGWEIDGWW